MAALKEHGISIKFYFEGGKSAPEVPDSNQLSATMPYGDLRLLSGLLD
jgi:hypothetical protein